MKEARREKEADMEKDGREMMQGERDNERRGTRLKYREHF